MLNLETLNRSADRRILEYFISLNAAAAEHWEVVGRAAEHSEVRELLVETAAMQRKVVEGLSDMLPRFLLMQEEQKP